MLVLACMSSQVAAVDPNEELDGFLIDNPSLMLCYSFLGQEVYKPEQCSEVFWRRHDSTPRCGHLRKCCLACGGEQCVDLVRDCCEACTLKRRWKCGC